ncbi:unnamed protein product, partial [Allacma fusca]
MAIIREQVSNSQIMQLLSPAIVGGNNDRNDIRAVNIKTVDVSGFESILITVLVGVLNAALGERNYLQIKLTHSDDNINFEACNESQIVSATGKKAANGIAVNVNSIAETNKAFMVAYIGHKRYIKPSITWTIDQGIGVPLAIAAILHGPKYRPVMLEPVADIGVEQANNQAAVNQDANNQGVGQVNLNDAGGANQGA